MLLALTFLGDARAPGVSMRAGLKRGERDIAAKPWSQRNAARSAKIMNTLKFGEVNEHVEAQ